MRQRISILARSCALLIVAVLSACDNLEWGGADIQIVPAPPPESKLPSAPDASVFAEFGLPNGPVMFHVVQHDGGGVTLIPIAELTRDSLRTLRRPASVDPDAFEGRFRETVMPTGAQFDVFRRGAHVGTFVAQAPGRTTACGVPTVNGNLTTVAAASDAPEFIAFRRGLAPEIRSEFTPPQVTGSIRTYASIVAERLILQAGLPRPRSWAGAQKDLQPIEIVEGAHPEMAATYTVGDSLAIGPADPQGYSVFYIADFETRRGYSPVFSQVRDYRRTGKAAPELVDYLDWNEDGQPEILIRVFGVDEAWYETVARTSSGWEKAWEGGRC